MHIVSSNLTTIDFFLFSTSSLLDPRPITEAYQAAYAFASSTATSAAGVGNRFVTRAEYLESGSLASHKKFSDWKSAEDLERAVYEQIGISDRDEDVLSDDKGGASAGTVITTTNKEKDTRKDGTKGTGRTRNRRDEQQRQTPRVDDPSSQVENPHQAPSAGGRITRTRSTRAGMAGIPK